MAIKKIIATTVSSRERGQDGSKNKMESYRKEKQRKNKKNKDVSFIVLQKI